MAYTAAAVDSDEYFHDTDWEIVANQGRYHVVEGCDVTFDAADMTYDIAAGQIMHNGGLVAVAAQTDAGTLVADATNERWAYVTLGSDGLDVLVSGDAAASSSVEPVKPELGDRVILYMVKIQAAQTIANNAEYKLDKRILAPTALAHRGPRAMHASATRDQDYIWEHVYLINGVTAWTTIATITDNNFAGAGGFGMGLVEAWVSGHTNAQGDAALFARWQFEKDGASDLQVGEIEEVWEDIDGAGAVCAKPGFRLLVSTNTILLQVQSSNGSNGLSGSAHVRVLLASMNDAAADWTIA